MFDRIAGRYALVNDLMTFGLDRGWRRTTIRRLGLPPQMRVLDLASGTGDLVRELERHDITAIGADLSLEMLRASGSARHRAVEVDGAALCFATGSFDGLVCGFALRNFTDLAIVLNEAGRVVRPGGRISLLEVDRPTLPVLRTGHRLWMTYGVPAIGALVSDSAAYQYLPRSLAYLPTPAELKTMLEAAGFIDVERARLSGGIVQVVSATRAGGRPISLASASEETSP
jgi:demethylmenaquinone methyltransferase / 2-methoxy-6-polyprenyl-1,4-benzoquinol methylase